jgi:hypothetical protein
MAVGDFDGDGDQDIFIAVSEFQNCLSAKYVILIQSLDKYQIFKFPEFK